MPTVALPGFNSPSQGAGRFAERRRLGIFLPHIFLPSGLVGIAQGDEVQMMACDIDPVVRTQGAELDESIQVGCVTRQHFGLETGDAEGLLRCAQMKSASVRRGRTGAMIGMAECWPTEPEIGRKI